MFFFCKFNELFLDTVREKQKGGRRKSQIEDSFFEEPEIDKDNQITFDQMNLSRPILKVFSFFFILHSYFRPLVLQDLLIQHLSRLLVFQLHLQVCSKIFHCNMDTFRKRYLCLCCYRNRKNSSFCATNFGTSVI